MGIAERLAGVVIDLASSQPRLAVALDGPDAAGKTTLASQLAGLLAVPVVAVGIDGFHRPRQDRYQGLLAAAAGAAVAARTGEPLAPTTRLAVTRPARKTERRTRPIKFPALTDFPQ